MITNPLVPARVQYAEYAEQFIPEFRGNPWIETLSEVLGPAETKARMALYPSYTPEIRVLEGHQRRLASGGLI